LKHGGIHQRVVKIGFEPTPIYARMLKKGNSATHLSCLRLVDLGIGVSRACTWRGSNCFVAYWLRVPARNENGGCRVCLVSETSKRHVWTCAALSIIVDLDNGLPLSQTAMPVENIGVECLSSHFLALTHKSSGGYGCRVLLGPKKDRVG
jgi:hypothetical protein